MAATYDELRRAVDLITQPLLTDVLLGAEAGKQPRDAVAPDADTRTLDAAVTRLLAIGALSTSVGPPGEASAQTVTLTARGAELIKILRESDDDTSR